MNTTILLFVLLVTVTSALPFDSASCLAQGRTCGARLARKSGVCRSGRARSDQPRRCHEEACAYCEENQSRRNEFPCSAAASRFNCRRPSQPAPAPAPASNGRCRYTGVNKIVINLGSVRMSGGWTAVRRNGMSGMIFDKNRRSRSIVAAGTQGVMCFPLRMEEAGQYYTTAITSAPHSTEHNDVWIRASTGFRLLKNGRFRSGSRGWMKGFQNLGKNRIADTLKTIDHNGHYLVTDVGNNQRFDLCIAGRSSRFEVFKLVLVKCSGNRCAPRDVARQMRNLSPSRCV